VGLDGYKKVIDSVDYVLIACAAKFHAMYLKAGIEAGKHVFVEKPHAIDPLGIRSSRRPPPWRSRRTWASSRG
jgi:myo-inositol 2-dehydrogenase/D-chiro-inositol 1-dehydrogenase